MKRYEMIKKNKDFQEIIHNKKVIHSPLFSIYKKNYPQTYPQVKFGIAVKKSFGNAVERNKIKRQIRNIVDKHKKEFKKGNYYIIMIKNTCIEKSYPQLEENFTSLIRSENE